MAGRFDFGSIGGAMSSALEDMLAQEEVRRRQRMLDEITVQRERRADELQRKAAEDLEYEREGRRAQQWAEDHAEGEVDPAMAEMLRRHGYGGGIEERTVEGAVQGDSETGDTRDPNRTALISQGGTRQIAARTAAQEKARLASEAAAAKKEAEAEKRKHEAEQKEKEREHKLELERMRQEDRKVQQSFQRSIAQQGLDLRQQAADDKREAAKKKEEEAAKVEQRRVEGLRRTASKIQTYVTKLYDPKAGTLTEGGSKISGKLAVPAWTAALPGVAGTQAADAHAALKTLQSLLDVDLIAEMKAQSKTGATGFGQLNREELAVLESAAAALKTYQSEEELARVLFDIYTNAGRGLVDLMPQEVEQARAIANKYPKPATGAGAAKPNARDLINRARGQ